MTIFFCYSVKSDVSVRYCSIHWVESRITRYKNNTAMYNWSTCTLSYIKWKLAMHVIKSGEFIPWTKNWIFCFSNMVKPRRVSWDNFDSVREDSNVVDFGLKFKFLDIVYMLLRKRNCHSKAWGFIFLCVYHFPLLPYRDQKCNVSPWYPRFSIFDLERVFLCFLQCFRSISGPGFCINKKP